MKMTVQTIEDYVACEEWQFAEIEAGLAEAERGDFASDAELAAVIARYAHSAHQGRHGENP